MKNQFLKNQRSFLSLLFLTSLLAVNNVRAISLDWGGSYRLEFTDIDRPALKSPGMKKNYLMHHLNLTPRILAADGVNVVADLELMPSSSYPDSRLGRSFGTGAQPNSGMSGTTSSNQSSSSIAINQLYLRAQQEYGSLLAGRAPLQFGIGMTHNAGTGAFDHWNQNRDLVAYKFMVGNFFVMPIVGKVNDNEFAVGGDTTDMIWDIEYSNPETESSIGLFWQQRTNNAPANDAHLSYGGTSKYGYSVASTNLYLARGFESVKFRFEAGFNSGGAGVETSTGDDVKVNGYGMVLETEFPNPESRWLWTGKFGLVSGDNPASSNYEGYALNRNYDVAFLLFNHPMGTHNPLQTNPYRYRSACATPPCSTYALNQAADEEMVSNTFFVAPKLDYRWSDKLSLSNTLVYAQAQTRSATDADRNLGTEWDIGLNYKPIARVVWLNQFGIFFPGAAWRGGPTVDAEASTNLGFRSALSLSF